MKNSNQRNIIQERIKRLGAAFVKRAWVSMLILLTATLAISMIMVLAPGNASDILGFESETHQPDIVTNLTWLFNAVFRFDFGTSFVHDEVPVWEILKPRLAKTAVLTMFSLAATLFIAFLLGAIGATGRYPRFSNVAANVSYLASAAPVYWVAFGAIYLFKVKFGWFPVEGGPNQPYPSWVYFILPICLLSIFNGVLGELIRHIRGELEDILKREYMQAVRARGLGRVKYWWHACRNALAPSIGLLTSNLTLLLGGAVVLEYVFTLRGIGYQAWESASKRDYPVILGITVILVLCVVLVRLFSDLLCSIIDPRFQSETEQ